MSTKLTIGYFYKNLLNLYGDNGNVEILTYRALRRGFDVEVVEVEPDTKLTSELMSKFNLIFMGGGPDSSQKQMYEDLLTNKGKFLSDYIHSGGVGLYICGSYQLLGQHYKASDGLVLEGLKIFDFYTQHFGPKKPRCIGNTTAQLSPEILSDEYFRGVNFTGTKIVGFENHGGRTYLGKNLSPFAIIEKGHGNNSQDKTEGLLYKNTIGSYFHGPILSRNPHIADMLIAKAVGSTELRPSQLPLDQLINSAHTASQKLPQ